MLLNREGNGETEKRRNWKTRRQRDRETGKQGDWVTGHPDTLLHHLYHSPLIRGSLIIGLTLVLITQVTIPLLAHWRYQRGLNYEKKKSFDRAILEYHMALRLLPSNAHYHTTFGNIYQRLSLQLLKERKSWLSEAIAEYEKAVSLSPMDSHYRKDLGIAYWLASEGKNKVLINKAISQFRESLRIDPTFPFAHASLGVIYAKMGWEDKAIEKFERAVYYEPNYVEARYNLAVLYSKKGLFGKVLSEYEKIIEIEQRNLFPKISCGYEGALLKFDYALAHLQLAGLYERGGRLKEAKTEYEYLLKIRPNFAPAKEALTRLKNIR